MHHVWVQRDQPRVSDDGWRWLAMVGGCFAGKAPPDHATWAPPVGFILVSYR